MSLIDNKNVMGGSSLHLRVRFSVLRVGLRATGRMAMLDSDAHAIVSGLKDHRTVIGGEAAYRRLYDSSGTLAHGDDQVGGLRVQDHRKAPHFAKAFSTSS